jgi:chromosome segregation ATPase
VNTEKVPKDRQLASVEQQTISLLKLEIEALQTEVAEKDGRLIDLAENANSGGDVDCESNAQLQRLIAELEQNDDRISDLEDALRASEEVAAADDAERRELQNWVDEIENRIAEKEEEWIAERDVLNRRLEDANDQYAAMLRRLEDHAQSGGSGFQDSMLVLGS